MSAAMTAAESTAAPMFPAPPLVVAEADEEDAGVMEIAVVEVNDGTGVGMVVLICCGLLRVLGQLVPDQCSCQVVILPGFPIDMEHLVSDPFARTAPPFLPDKVRNDLPEQGPGAVAAPPSGGWRIPRIPHAERAIVLAVRGVGWAVGIDDGRLRCRAAEDDRHLPG
jgi:hypothetical protein